MAGNVVIGMDPHKRSATIAVMDEHETVLDGGRFGTDAAGYRAMLTFREAMARSGLGCRRHERDRAPHRGPSGPRR